MGRCFPREEKGNRLQYSCLENPMDRRAWQATVHGIVRVGLDLATKLGVFQMHRKGWGLGAEHFQNQEQWSKDMEECGRTKPWMWSGQAAAHMGWGLRQKSRQEPGPKGPACWPYISFGKQMLSRLPVRRNLLGGWEWRVKAKRQTDQRFVAWIQDIND